MFFSHANWSRQENDIIWYENLGFMFSVDLTFLEALRFFMLLLLGSFCKSLFLRSWNHCFARTIVREQKNDINWYQESYILLFNRFWKFWKFAIVIEFSPFRSICEVRVARFLDFIVQSNPRWKCKLRDTFVPWKNYADWKRMTKHISTRHYFCKQKSKGLSHQMLPAGPNRPGFTRGQR